MTRPSADIVKVEWTGSGNGSPITLGTAVAGFNAFPSALNGLRVSYSIEHQVSPEREAGIGVYTHSGTTLTRERVTASTNAGARVSFSAGSKHVRIVSIAQDLYENRATTDPTSGDGRSQGYVAGRSRWLNTSTEKLWICLNDDDVSSPSNVVWGRVVTADEILGADTAPTQVTSNAATFTLTNAARLHLNVEILSHQANVDFTVAATAGASSKWFIRPKHNGCIVSVAGDAGSVNGISGGSARLINGGAAAVMVDSNAGSAPAVVVVGDVITGPVLVNSTRTYGNDDHGQDFELIAGAGMQTMPIATDAVKGLFFNIFNTSGGNVTIDGADADVVLANGTMITVKKLNTRLSAFGSGGITVLDLA